MNSNTKTSVVYVFKLLTILSCLMYVSHCKHHSKISREVEQNIRNGDSSNVIVEFQDSNLVGELLNQISEKSNNPTTSRSKEVTDLFSNLPNNFISAINPFINLLQSLKIAFNLLWATSQAFIPGATGNIIRQVVQLGIVKFVRVEFVFTPKIPPQTPGSRPQPTGNQSYNIGLMNARCPNITCLGKGILIGFSDTGARSTHVEIRDNFLGKTNNLLGFLNGIQTKDSNSTYLCTATDPVGHGTHVVGSAVGKNVGVAPEALWMMCLDCTASECPESAMIICGQWLACPYHCNDTRIDHITKNCSKRPDIISNSWVEDITTLSVVPYYFYYKIVQLWNSMGIMSVFGGGNEGPVCTTFGFPAGYPITIGVGLVDENVTLVSFSSTGPALSTKPFSEEWISSGTCSLSDCKDDEDICSIIKPDVVAPGYNINSSNSESDTDYGLRSGTSMATPQVAGVLALMKCANRNVTWTYKEGYGILIETADTSRIDVNCERQNKGDVVLKQTNNICNKMISGICGTFPNNMYGYGLVYACDAVIAAKKRKPKGI